MKWLIAFIALFFMPLAAGGVEETSRETDRHIIYFNLFSSSFLDPEIAQQYDLQRSRYRAVLNLAVHEKMPEVNKPISVLLEGTVTNIAQQQRQLNFREVREGDAIYYLSDFRVTDDDLMTFDIKIRATADSPGYDLRFKRRVFTAP